MTNKEIKQWIIKANNDLKAAKHELSFPPDEIVTESVCFHSQQAVEKYFKAYLIYKNHEFGPTHNLEYLQQLCGKYDKSILTFELGNLTNYAVQVRYPDDFYIPDYEEANEAYRLAKAIKENILKKIEGVNND